MVITKASVKRTRVAATNARAVRRKTSKQPETPVEIFSSQETLPTGSSSSNLQASFAAQDVELGTEAFRAASNGTGVVLPLAPAADNAAVVAESSSSALVPSVEAELEERWFLALGSKIVGVQHYNGVVSDREEVVLRRQPTNMYDRNAIQVLNIRGEQIGHVPREMASLLAPVMDRFSDGTELRVEGHIPRGSGNVYSIPVRLQIYGQNNPETASPSVSAAPAMLQRLGQQLQRTYCTAARGAVEVVTAPDPMGTPVQELTPEMWRQINGGKGAKKTSKLGPTMHDVINRELEEIFRQPGGYEGSPMAQQPESLKTDLYPHQLKALHWMIQQERPLTVADKLAEATAPKDHEKTIKPKRGRQTGTGPTTTKADAAQVFFWIKDVSKGQVIYKNLATNSAFKHPPLLPRGGILADDMGLGKTITTITLMLSSMDKAKAFRSSRISGQNLVVCPLSVLYNWSEQLKLHAPSLKVRTYHGADRDRSAKSFSLHDVTLTTYDIVRAEVKDRSRGLGSVQWYRAILDEAHVIKGHKQATAQAIFQLVEAECKWCLTGTPIQNSAEDLYALARFLKLEPFDHFDWFNRTILRPLKNRDVVGFERLQVVLRSWCLRRTKDQRITDADGKQRPLLLLPSKSVEVYRVPLEPADRVLYERLFNCASERVKEMQNRSQLGQNFSQVLSLLTRLRQLCCSTALLPENLLAELRSGKGDSDSVFKAAVAALGSSRVEALIKNLAEAQEDDCSICMEPSCDIVTRCGHVFHRACIETALRQLGRAGEGHCPLCRNVIRKAELLEKPAELELVEGDEETGKDGIASSKIRAVISFLHNTVIEKKDPQGKPHKAVIFSQFTAFLNLIQSELKSHRLPFVRLDGSMTHDARVHAQQSFAGHPHIQVMLCSLKAAGTGLNLTAADHVLLIDPWWNPAVEDQAIDRLHRLGQRRPVRALRFVAERTVEERILEVQKQKRAIVEGALSKKSRDELQKIRLEMISSIFDPL
mgnify:FL=1